MTKTESEKIIQDIVVRNTQVLIETVLACTNKDYSMGSDNRNHVKLMLKTDEYKKALLNLPPVAGTVSRYLMELL